MKIGKYHISDQLFESERTRVYLGTLDNSDKKYIVKVAARPTLAGNRDLSIRNEFEITRHLDKELPGSEIFKSEENLVLVREYLEGTTLSEWIENRAFDLAERLDLGVKIAESLDRFHIQQFIHKDFNPNNVIISPDASKVTAIDFDLSSRLDFKSYYLGNPQKLEGAIPYISPEQTGRMNRAVDYRSDLYSLGVVLYELFTEQLPFGKEDPLEIIHGHLSRKPSALYEINPRIPDILSKIVLKLLEKNAEDRYQSASCVVLDIRRCAASWAQSGAIEVFEIACLDKPMYFQIPARLYGREAESKELMRAFKIAAAGRKVLVPVGGYSGIGKSALIYDIHIPVTMHRGFFVDGKFEQIQRNTPYLAWIQALEKFVEILLTEDKETLQYWREKILQSLGGSAGVITELVPTVENIIGKQEIPENLSVMEDLNRFNYALRQFIKAISTPEHPLVIFLDDLQWADAASLYLLKVIMTEPGLGYLTIIAAYRDNEVDEKHPFAIGLKELEKDWKKVNETDTSLAYAADNQLIFPVVLKNLHIADIIHILSDTFKSKSPEISELAELIFEKTKGNSFFIHRFLESMYTEGLIELKTKNGVLSWSFDFAGIKNMHITDNVIDLMSKQMKKLPESARVHLQHASCLGFQFDIKSLRALMGNDIQQIEAELWPAIEAGYIVPTDSSYKYVPGAEHKEDYNIKFKFAHDRIRQLFYQTLQKDQIMGIHMNAAHILIDQVATLEQSDRIFEMAGHVNAAENLFTDKNLVRKINIQAGKKAKASSAYETAYDYYTKAIEQSQPDDWTGNYQQHLELYIETAECSYQSGEYQETENLITEILKHTQSPIDFARAIEIRCDAYFVQQRMEEAVQAGVGALKMLGLSLPNKPGQLSVVKELLGTKWKMRNHKPDDLLKLDPLKDIQTQAIMRLMAILTPPAFFSDINLFIIISLRMTSISVKKGLSAAFAYSLSNYGNLLCAATGELEKGSAYSSAAMEMIKQKAYARYKVRAKFVNFFFVHHRLNPVYDSLEPLKDAFQQGLESGDSNFTAFLGNAYTSNALQVGYDLDEINLDLRRMLQYSTQVKNYTSRTFTEIYYQFASCLQGDAPDPSILDGYLFDSGNRLKELKESNNRSTLFNFYYFQSQLYLLFGDYRKASETGDRMMALSDSVIGTPAGLFILLLNALLQYHHAFEEPGHRQSAIKKLKSYEKKLAKFGRFTPKDFKHKISLIKACLAALSNNPGEALILFQRSGDEVDKSINRYDAALITLTFGRYCKTIGLNDLSLLKLKQSAALFTEWGANAVSDEIKAGFNDLQLAAPDQYIGRETVSSSSNSGGHEGIDIFSVIKGTQVISGELELEYLIKNLLLLMIENAGAEKGALILEVDGQFFVHTETDHSGVVKALDNVPLDQYTRASQAVLNYVYHSGNPVILDHAHLTGRFINDGYIQENKVRSLLCMNIMHKSKLIGLLYLENNLISAAFTPGRIEILNILATQAAISIENARYYRQINDLNKSYERFVPKSFLSQLEKESILDIALGDQVSRNMTVMFSDIRGFTSMSEQLSPTQVFSLLNEVWGMLNPVIDRNLGIIDKYIGDAIMALFPDNPQQALHAAIEMQKTLAQFNRLRQNKGLFPIKMGMGLHCGPMILGTVGSDARMNTTVIGDTVNIASRLETMSKSLNASVLLTSTMVKRIKDRSIFRLRDIGRISVKGKSKEMNIFEEYSITSADTRDLIEEHSGLFSAYLETRAKGQKEDSLALLKQYRVLVPDDTVAQYYWSLEVIG